MSAMGGITLIFRSGGVRVSSWMIVSICCLMLVSAASLVGGVFCNSMSSFEGVVSRLAKGAKRYTATAVIPEDMRRAISQAVSQL